MFSQEVHDIDTYIPVNFCQKYPNKVTKGRAVI